MSSTLAQLGSLAFIAVLAFFVLTLLRHLLIQRKRWVFVYPFFVSSILFVVVLDGGGVQNADYARLEK